MPEVTTATTDKTASASVGMDSTAAWDACNMHPTAADMHPAPTMTAAAMRSEYGSRDEQASGYCRD
jgi:hypothetical protein